MNASQLTSRCSTKKWARTPDSVFDSGLVDMEISSLVRGHRVRRNLDRSAVIKKTRPGSHHLFAGAQPLRDHDGTVANITGLHGPLRDFVALDHKNAELRLPISLRMAVGHE